MKLEKKIEVYLNLKDKLKELLINAKSVEEFEVYSYLIDTVIPDEIEFLNTNKEETEMNQQYVLISTNPLTNTLCVLLEDGRKVYLKLEADEAVQALDALQLHNIIRSRILNQEIGE